MSTKEHHDETVDENLRTTNAQLSNVHVGDEEIYVAHAWDSVVVVVRFENEIPSFKTMILEPHVNNTGLFQPPTSIHRYVENRKQETVLYYPPLVSVSNDLLAYAVPSWFEKYVYIDINICRYVGVLKMIRILARQRVKKIVTSQNAREKRRTALN